MTSARDDARPGEQKGWSSRRPWTSSNCGFNNTHREEAPTERHIGMDVDAASCKLAVIYEKGRELKDFDSHHATQQRSHSFMLATSAFSTVARS